MTPGKKIFTFLKGLAIVLLQVIMTQVVTLLASFLAPGMENFPQTRPVLFVAILGITYSAGVFLVGWLALRLGWLKARPMVPARLAGALIGAYLPLILALFLYHPLEAGNPFFFVSMVTCILGFYLPGWLARE